MMVQLALVSNLAAIAFAEVANVSAAIQKQIARDAGPIWGVPATIDAFPSLDEVPVGYWRIVVVEETPGNGTHYLAPNGQPLALVEAGPSWSLSASHEALEMLVDPFGNRVLAGDSPQPGQGRVEFLVEICDPCQDASHAYTCNGLLVSDFVTPSYFDPVAGSSTRYSFRGSIRRPFEVLKGGSLSWREPSSGHWHQLSWFSDQPQFDDLGLLATGATLRGTVDEAVPRPTRLSHLDKEHPVVAAAAAQADANVRASRSNAAQLRQLIATRRPGAPVRTTPSPGR